MPRWRKKLTVVIFLALAVLAFLFRNGLAGALFAYALIQGILLFLFRGYASSDLAETFQEDGKNVKGWRS